MATSGRPHAAVAWDLYQANAHFLAGLEDRDTFSATGTCSPVRGLRPMRASRFFTEKAPEPSDLHPVAARQGLRDLVEDGVHHVLRVAKIELGVMFRDFLHQFGLDHRSFGPAVVSV